MKRDYFSKVFVLFLPILMLFAFSAQAFAKTTNSSFDLLEPELLISAIALESISFGGDDEPDAAKVFHLKEIQTVSSDQEPSQASTLSGTFLDAPQALSFSSGHSLEPPINLSNRMVTGEMILQSSDKSLPFVGTAALRLGLTSSGISS